MHYLFKSETMLNGTSLFSPNALGVYVAHASNILVGKLENNKQKLRRSQSTLHVFFSFFLLKSLPYLVGKLSRLACFHLNPLTLETLKGSWPSLDR